MPLSDDEDFKGAEIADEQISLKDLSGVSPNPSAFSRDQSPAGSPHYGPSSREMGVAWWMQ